MPDAPASLFDEAKDQRLAQLYAPCFTLILQLRASHEFGDAEVLRRRIKDLFDDAEREAARLGIPGDDTRAAKFGIVAFIDETILSSDWSQKDRWVARPLQLELYDRYDAGEVFFDRLDQFLADSRSHAEVLEVYYLCMTLGFKGRYQLHDQERLRVLIEQTFEALKRSPGMSVGDLSPHGKPRDQVATEVRNQLPAWIIAAFAAALAVIIYVGMSLYMNSTADGTASTINDLPRPEATR